MSVYAPGIYADGIYEAGEPALVVVGADAAGAYTVDGDPSIINWPGASARAADVLRVKCDEVWP